MNPLRFIWIAVSFFHFSQSVLSHLYKNTIYLHWKRFPLKENFSLDGKEEYSFCFSDLFAVTVSVESSDAIVFCANGNGYCMVAYYVDK